jgi:hypothetical protein
VRSDAGAARGGRGKPRARPDPADHDIKLEVLLDGETPTGNVLPALTSLLLSLAAAERRGRAAEGSTG